MEKSSTREEILEIALDLFSVNGYEATSISQIADAVGIRKASLYSHFGSKQEIMDSVMEMVLSGFDESPLLSGAAGEDPGSADDRKGMDAESAAKLIQEEIRSVLHHPVIGRGRRMLTIEQFRNEELSVLQTGTGYVNMLRYFEGMIDVLTESKKLRGEDREIMAAQLASPVMAWISLCDREPGREEEVMDLVKRHVLQFFKVYGQKAK